MRIRNVLSSFQLAVLIVSALLIAVFSYLTVRVYHHRFDLTKGRIYSLAPQTLQVLKVLEREPIEASAFFRENQPGKLALENLLKEYAYHHPEFRYHFYDPDRMPGKVRQYQIEAYETLVIETRGRREKTRQVTEEAITNLLAKAVRDETKRITFVAGQGGPPLNEREKQSGFGLLGQRLEDSNYEIQETLLVRDKISKGTDVLVLGGPRVDLLPEEMAIIREYWRSGGNILMLLDPFESGEGKNFGQFLSEFSVTIQHDVIIDKLSKLFGADYLIPLITEYKPHPVTAGFRAASFFPIARSVRKADRVPENMEIAEIAWTGAGSWAETDLKKLAEGKAEFDQKKDRAGPLPVALAARHTEGKGRLVVFGDSDFTTNAYLNLSGNKDLFLNAVAWLSGDELAISIRPRVREVTPLYLKETDQQSLFYESVVGLPFLCLLTGTGVFFWRKRYD